MLHIRKRHYLVVSSFVQEETCHGSRLPFFVLFQVDLPGYLLAQFGHEFPW